jgi:uncharacterized protein DUF4159
MNRLKTLVLILVTLLLLPVWPGAAENVNPPAPGEFVLARLKYGGGGDWYSNPSSLPNLISATNKWTEINISSQEKVVSLMDENLFSFPYIYLTGHGNIKLSDVEARKLKAYLEGGGFLHADDNYGIDKYLRAELKRVFPDAELVELPFDHPIYHTVFDFPKGLPKVHEHDGGPPKGYGLFINNRLCVFYSFNTDLGDGWESPEVHHDPEPVRQAALKMGTNIITYALTN